MIFFSFEFMKIFSQLSKIIIYIQGQASKKNQTTRKLKKKPPNSMSNTSYQTKQYFNEYSQYTNHSSARNEDKDLKNLDKKQFPNKKQQTSNFKDDHHHIYDDKTTQNSNYKFNENSNSNDKKELNHTLNKKATNEQNNLKEPSNKTNCIQSHNANNNQNFSSQKTNNTTNENQKNYFKEPTQYNNINNMSYPYPSQQTNINYPQYTNNNNEYSKKSDHGGFLNYFWSNDKIELEKTQKQLKEANEALEKSNQFKIELEIKIEKYEELVKKTTENNNQKIIDFNNKINKITEENEDLKTDLRLIQCDLERKCNENDKNLKIIEENSNIIKKNEKDLEIKKNDIILLKNKENELKAEYEINMTRIKNDFNEIKSNLSIKIEENGKLLSKNRDLELDLGKLDQIIDNTKEALSEKEKQIKELLNFGQDVLKKNENQKTKDKNKNKAEKDQLKREIESVNDLNSALKDENDKLKEINEEMQNEINGLLYKVEKIKENDKKIADLERALLNQKIEFEEILKKNKDKNGVLPKLRDVFFKIFEILMQKCKVGDRESDDYLEVFMDKELSMEEIIGKANKLADEDVFN